jgi:uncharacterized SAM-binding protein YcdF (DUF218 family)
MVLGAALGKFRSGKALMSLGLVGLFVFAMPVTSGWLTVALEQGLPLAPPPDNMPRAIIILGGEVSRSVEPPFTRPGRLTLDRLRAGAALHRLTGLPILVTGGIVQRDRPAVAQVMADSLRTDFLTQTDWVEDKSGTTWANAVLSAAMLKKQGIASVYVVSQAWHLRRAVIAFRKAGMTVTAAPTMLDPPATPILLDFLPTASAWYASFFAVHEWVGCVWYSLL